MQPGLEVCERFSVQKEGKQHQPKGEKATQKEEREGEGHPKEKGGGKNHTITLKKRMRHHSMARCCRFLEEAKQLSPWSLPFPVGGPKKDDSQSFVTTTFSAHRPESAPQDLPATVRSHSKRWDDGVHVLEQVVNSTSIMVGRGSPS